MTNANDLLWWDDEYGETMLVYGDCELKTYAHADQWYWCFKRTIPLAARTHDSSGHGYAPTREAAMQGAVDSAEAAGVDFSKAPRWKYSECIFLTMCAIVHLSGEWFVRDTTSSVRSRLASGTAPTESRARTAAIAAMRREVQKMIEQAKGELGV